MKQLKIKLQPLITHPLAWILAGLLPCMIVFGYLLIAEKKLQSLEEQALFLQKKHLLMKDRQKKEKKLLSQLKEANRDYVEKELESLQFLSPEIQKLQALIYSETSNEMQKKRLEFLERGENALRFRQQNYKRQDNFQEVEMIQQHPVEMNRGDLKNLLARIENCSIGEYPAGNHPPDFLIKNFELLKKPLASNEETFVIHLELIQREAIYE